MNKKGFVVIFILSISFLLFSFGSVAMGDRRSNNIPEEPKPVLGSFNSMLTATKTPQQECLAQGKRWTAGNECKDPAVECEETGGYWHGSDRTCRTYPIGGMPVPPLKDPGVVKSPMNPNEYVKSLEDALRASQQSYSKCSEELVALKYKYRMCTSVGGSLQ